MLINEDWKLSSTNYLQVALENAGEICKYPNNTENNTFLSKFLFSVLNDLKYFEF